MITAAYLEPAGVVTSSVIFTAMISILSLNAYWCCTTSTRLRAIRLMSSKAERLCVLAHYIVALPLFEVFVVAGPHMDIKIGPNSPSVVVTWICLLVLGLLGFAIAFWSTRAHIFSLQFAQLLQGSGAVLILCDRAINRRLGVEAVFIIALLVCVAYEMRERAQPLDRLPPLELQFPTVQTQQQNYDNQFNEEINSPRELRSRGAGFESDLDSDVIAEHAARRHASGLLDFFKNIRDMDISNIKDSKKRTDLENLQRQAEVFILTNASRASSSQQTNGHQLPTPRTVENSHTSADVDSRGQYGHASIVDNDEDDF